MTQIVLAKVPKASVPEGALRRLPRPPYDILLVQLDGVFHAIEDACPHSGRSLSEGHLHEGCVVCPGHGWHVELESGAVRTAVGAGQSNPVFEVRTVADELWIYGPRT